MRGKGIDRAGAASTHSAAHDSAPAAKPPKKQRAAAPSAPVAAQISGFAFAPADVRVEVGQEITWTNEDSAPHTVTATSGADLDSGTLEQGASFTFKAAAPGTIEYFCEIHPSMTGTITVVR